MSDALLSPHPAAPRDRWLLAVLAATLDEDTIHSLELSSARSIWVDVPVSPLVDPLLVLAS